MTISAVAGSVVAAGLVVGMLFEGWLDSLLSAGSARVADFGAVAVIAGLLYIGLRAFADAVAWTRAEPGEWIAYAGLNAIGAGVILHVAVGRRWPFMPTAKTGASR
jgi:protein-S-isoprenylcysteine O-methyltransferase Ste14